MRILMWREEKQHMIWTLRGETNVSLLKARAILSLPTLLLEGSSDHRSHCSPMTRITQQITVWTEMFFSFPSQSLLCTADNQTQQMMKKKKNYFLPEDVHLSSWWILTTNILPAQKQITRTTLFVCLQPITQQSFQLCTQPSQTGETLLIRFPMANHVDVVAANWNWDQGALGNNWENNPLHGTQRWICKGQFSDGC